MATQKRGLGRGLDALLPSATPKTHPQTAAYGESGVFICPVEQITPQQGQPRQHFAEEDLVELANSIREHGVIEPLVVRRLGTGPNAKFELIAGERRWRAAQRAGLKELLVVVKDVSPMQAFEMALVENIQRADLDAIEVAEAYDRLIREHTYTQEKIATRLGKDRSTVANALRLLKLPPRVRTMVIQRELSEGHARALLGAPDDKTLMEIADKTVRGRLPVRTVEKLIRNAKHRKATDNDETKTPKGQKSAAVRDLEARLMRRLGTKVEIAHAGPAGTVVVHYGSLDELDRILATLDV